MNFAEEQEEVKRIQATPFGVSLGAGSFISPTAAIGRESRIGNYSMIGENVKIGERTKIWHYVNVLDDVEIAHDVMIASHCQVDPYSQIGPRTRIQPFCGVNAKIGADCFISVHVMFTNSKYPPTKRFDQIVIGDHVIIGAGAMINPGLRIGDHAVIDSGALVTHDIPPYEEWRGVPARYYRPRGHYDSFRVMWEKGEEHLLE